MNPSNLRAAALCCFFMAMLPSCSHHDDTGGGNPVNNSYLASVYDYVPGALLVDSFTYDAQKRVGRYAQYLTSSGNTYAATFDFSFSGNNALPDSYLYTDEGNNEETHQLTFDGQGRIVKDTCSSNHFVTYYTYSGDYTICSILFEGTMDDAFIDSLKVTDGNLTAEKVWGADYSPWEKQGDIAYGHATAANPGYKAEIAGSVGPLLYVLSTYNYGGYADFISKAVMNKITGVSDGLPASGVNYSIKADSKGRVSTMTASGVGVPSGVQTVFNYY